VARSDDGGVTWSPVVFTALTAAPLSAVDCEDDGCLATSSARTGQILWSADGGPSWTARPPLGFPPPEAEYFGPELVALDCLPGGTCLTTGLFIDRYSVRHLVYRTTDWGATWASTSIAPRTETRTRALACADVDHCWVGGTSDTPSTIWATGAASSPGMAFYGQFTGIGGPHTVTGFACVDANRCKATVTTPTGSRIIDTANGGAATPVITGITPDHGTAAGGTTVTITGHGFTGATGVRFGQSSAAFTVVADDRVVATAPPGDPAYPLTPILIETPEGRVISAVRFLYDFPLDVTMSPTRCAFDSVSSCDIVEFTGTGLPAGEGVTDAVRVRFGTIPLPVTCERAVRCYVVTPRPAQHPELVNTVVPVTFETDGGSQTFAFTYGPSVTSLDPPDGTPAGGPVTITGLGLGGVTGVRFGGVAVPFTIVDDTRVTTVAPPGEAETDAMLSLTTNLGDFALATVFLYRSPPVITDLIPSYGAVGTTIMLEGSYLQDLQHGIPVRGVWFGTVRSPNVSCSEDSCWVQVPDGTGTVPVTVATGGGTSAVTPAAMFTYYPAPDVTGMSPSSGPAAGGNTVVFTGRGLADPVRVHFGEALATVVSSSDTSVTVLAPPGQPGSAVYTGVETRGGRDGYPEETFVYRYS
jgi:hypothetical protein